jgi:hypothetical protein
MLAEIISDMKSNMTFLAPLLSGIVVGLAAMITAILSKIDFETGEIGVTALGDFATIIDLFDYLQMIPPYYLQIAVGIYIIQVIFILTSALVVIDSGEDKLQKTSKTGKNLLVGIGFYFITSLVATLALFILAGVVLVGIIG